MKRLYILLTVLLIAIYCMEIKNIYADETEQKTIYSYFYDLAEWDCTDKSTENQQEILSLLEQELDSRAWTDETYRCLCVDLPGRSDNQITIMTPIYYDIDGLSSLSGIAVMQYLADIWDSLDAYYGVRLIFLPESYPYSLTAESQSVIVLGSIVGGDRLFLYDIGDPVSLRAVRTAAARKGTVTYEAPARFLLDIPAGLEYYSKCLYIERSLWWYDSASTGEYVGTRYYQTVSAAYADSSGHITGYGRTELERLGSAFGWRDGMRNRLEAVYEIVHVILCDEDIFSGASVSDNDPDVPDITTPANPAIPTESSTPEMPSLSEPSSVDEESSAQGHVAEVSEESSEEDSSTSLPATPSSRHNKMSPMLFLTLLLLAIVGIAIGAAFVVMRRHGIRPLLRIKDIIDNMRKSGKTEPTADTPPEILEDEDDW